MSGVRYKTWQSFLVGICLGLSTALLVTLQGWTTTFSHGNLQYSSTDRMYYSNSDQFGDTKYHKDDDSVAKKLYENVRVACWILTSPMNLDTKAIHVKNTWAKRCNVVLFMSSVHNESFPTIGLNVTEGRYHLTEKSMQAFEYIYDNHFNDADWFLKADDDTYVIMENLRYFLSAEDSGQPVYFGLRFMPHVTQGYASGGGGYVLSKEALRRFGQLGVKNTSLCSKYGISEDVEIGQCMANLRVSLKSSLDSLNRTRFHSFTPETVISSKFPYWFSRYASDGVKGGLDNISDYAISFHYVEPTQMYALEFFTYHLRPYGVLNLPMAINARSTPDQTYPTGDE